MKTNDKPCGSAVSLVALGDLMITADHDDPGLDPAAQLSALRARIDDADVVFANLESTTFGTTGFIAKEPRLVATPEMLEKCLLALRPSVVSLANNHAFDCNETGFHNVRGILDRLGIAYFGAGDGREEAGASLITTVRGRRLGWLGYVAIDTTPSHVAGAGSGVNPFETDRAVADVAELRSRVDDVIVSVHWGAEYCHLPSPSQIDAARRIIDAGASVLLGHHAHVVQAVERRPKAVIAYNLGNAITTDLRIGNRLAIKQSRRTKSSAVVRIELGPQGPRVKEVTPYRLLPADVSWRDSYASKLCTRANRALAGGVSTRRWRWHRTFEDLVLRPLWKLDPRVVRSIRPEHFGRLAQAIGTHIFPRRSQS